MSVFTKLFKRENINKIEKVAFKADEIVSFVDTKVVPNLNELEEIKDTNLVKNINDFVPKASVFLKKSSTAIKTIEMIISQSKLEKIVDTDVNNKINEVATNALGGTLSKATLGVSAGLAGVSILVLVVNIYQTRQVSKKMSRVSSEIEDIKEFQLIDYRNRVKSLVIDILNILDNKDLLFKKKDVRKRELENLDNYEHECERLLGHANDAIISLTKRSQKSYANYKKHFTEIEGWLSYQSILVTTLTQIAELKYALNLGSVSKEYCFNKLNKYLLEANDSVVSLKEWHNKNIKAFEIDFENKKYRKSASFFNFLRKIKEIDEKVSYSALNDEEITIIQKQLEYKDNNVVGSNDDVVIIIKDGKYYFQK